MKAIILKKQATKEFDQLVTCYTQELGKITGIAKSSLKENSIQGRHLAVLNMVDFDLINGRSTPIITGAQCDRSFPAIKSSLIHTAAASFFAEVIERTAYDHQHDERLWEFLVATMSELETLESSEVLAWFRDRQKAFLEVMGYAPTLPMVASTRMNDPDAVYEYTFGRQFASLKFLSQVI